MNADDLQLADRFASSTAHLEARPGLADVAARGGRRRIQRHRSIAVGVAAALTLIIALPFTPLGDFVRNEVAPARPDRSDRYGLLLDRPTGGDLASDRAYGSAVLAMWNRQAPGFADGIGKDRLGEPKLAWAGTTGVGPASVVVQLARMPSGSALPAQDAGQTRTLIGFVGVDGAERPRLVAYDSWQADSADVTGSAGNGVTGWFVDPARTVLAVRDVGVPMGWGPYLLGDIDESEVQPLQFEQGAAVITLTLGTDPDRVWLTTLPPGGNGTSTGTVGDGAIAQPGGIGLVGAPLLGWTRRPMFLTGPTHLGHPQDDFAKALVEAHSPGATGVPEILATGRMNRSEVLIGAGATDGNGRAYAVIIPDSGRTTVVDGGPLDPEAALPIKIRLPGAFGWAVVRNPAGFQFKIGAGRWQDGGEYAALLPETSTAVRVTPYFGAGPATVVPLR